MRGPLSARFALLAGLLLTIAISAHAAQPVGIQETVLHPAMPDYPIEVNHDAAGTLYVSDHYPDRIWLVEPSTGDYLVYFVDSPSDAKPDAQGKIWWTNEGNRFGRIDPVANTVTIWPIAPVGEANLWGLDFDQAGRVWLVEWYRGSVHRFDPASQQLCSYDWSGTSSSYYVAYDQPYVWFINQFTGRIFRLDPVAAPAQLHWWDIDDLLVPLPRGVAVDGAGGFWWADAGMHALARLDPATDQMTRYSLPHGTGPQQVYLLEGKVWYTESDAGTYGALDPAVASGVTTVLDAGSETIDPTCTTLVAEGPSSLTPLTGTFSWAANSMNLLQDSGGWTVYELPDGAAPYGLAQIGGQWWLSDPGRGKLVRTLPPVQPDYTLDKTGDTYSKWDGETGQGDVVNYTITLENTGDADLVLSSFVDTLEPGVVVPASCATLSVGETCSFSYSHTVTQAEGTGSSLTNTATAVYGLAPGYGVPDTLERSDSHTVSLLHPDYTLDKTGDTYSKWDGETGQGDVVNYAITLQNTGDATLVLSSFVDTLEPGVVVPASCATLSVGETCSFSYSHTVTEAEGAEDSLTNTATAVYGLAPGYGLSNSLERSDSHAVTLLHPDYTLDKAGDPYSKWDSETGQGDVINYTITLENTGDVTLVLNSFVDTLVPGVVVPASCATLSVGEACSFSYSHTVTEAEGTGNSLGNTATAVYGLAASYGLSNSLERGSSYSVTLLHPDYTLDKTGVANLTKGVVDYTITLENTGDATLVLGSFVDTLEPGVVVPASCATLSVGETCSFSYSHTVTEAERTAGSVTNTATAVYQLAAGYGLSNSLQRSDSHRALLGSRIFLPIVISR